MKKLIPLKVKSVKLSLIKKLKERRLSLNSNFNRKYILPFKYKKTIVVNSYEKLDSLKKDVQSLSDSFIDIINQGDSQVKINVGFNNKQKMDKIMKKYFSK
jgi:hypothetical protein